MSEQSRRHSRFFLPAAAGVLYFSEGLPYGIVKEFVPMVLRFQHVDLTNIGLLNAVGFAWTLKFLWSPLIDTFGAYRRWIAGAVLAIAIALFSMGAVMPGPLFYGLVALLALASATQDIAVDAFTIRATPKELLGPVNSIRVTAYRIALTAPGLLAALAQRRSWGAAFSTAGFVMLVVFAVTLALPDDRGALRNERPDFIAALRHWLLRPRAGTLLAIALTYRVGELGIVAMIKPYWVDRGYSPAEIGTITSIIGVVVSIAGAIAGGAIVARIGIYRALLWLGAAQCLSNLGYALVATVAAGRWAIYAAAVVENLGYGLGTAAFLTFLMSICDRERAATEYALLSAAYGLTGTLIATASGYLAKHAGYAGYFWLTVVLGLPALVLIPRVRSVVTE